MKHSILLEDDNMGTLIGVQLLFSKIKANMRFLDMDFEDAARLATMRIELPDAKPQNCRCIIKLVRDES